MLCQICGKNPATVHFTEIHDQKMSEIHVCERCAEEKGLHATAKKQQFDIADLLVKMVDQSSGTEEERVGHVQCPHCGLAYSDNKGMKEAIKELSANPEMRVRMGENGFRAIMEELNSDMIRKPLCDMFSGF